MWTLIVVILSLSNAGNGDTTSFVVPNFTTEKACRSTGNFFSNTVGQRRYVVYDCARVK